MSKKICLLILLLIMVFIPSCSQNNKGLSKTDFCFDTYVTITVYDKSELSIIDEAFKICHKYDDLLSKSSENGDIKKIENNRHKYVDVSMDTINILNIYKELYEISEHKFDPSIGCLSSCWTYSASDDFTIPDKNVIDNAKATVDINSIEISNHSINLNSDDACLDFGAVAKGYISGEIKKFLTDRGVKSAIINMGGNVVLVGAKPDNSAFKVGIQKPFTDNDESISTVFVSDKSVITAGVYQRYIKYKGEIFHHIIDPITGFCSDTDLLSATIISDNPAYADAYSTICMLLGSKKSIEIINNNKDLECILITKNYDIITSRNAKEYLKENR